LINIDDDDYNEGKKLTGYF